MDPRTSLDPDFRRLRGCLAVHPQLAPLKVAEYQSGALESRCFEGRSLPGCVYPHFHQNQCLHLGNSAGLQHLTHFKVVVLTIYNTATIKVIPKSFDALLKLFELLIVNADLNAVPTTSQFLGLRRFCTLSDLAIATNLPISRLWPSNTNISPLWCCLCPWANSIRSQNGVLL